MQTMISFSVLLSLFYKENPDYLDQCFESLNKQTLQPTEIICVVEGELSSNLLEVLNKWIDTFSGNLKPITVPLGTGFPKSLNIGINNCKYEWIARMDTDDICKLNRFETQVKYIQSNPNVDFLGSYIEEYDESMQKLLSIRTVPIQYKEILKFGKKRNPFNHMTMFYKKSIVQLVGGYPILRSNEDYGLWGLLLQNKFIGLNIPEPLIMARAGEGLIKRRKGKKYLQGEIESIKFLYHIKFFSFFDYSLNYIIRTIIRHLPFYQVNLIYKFFLRK